MTGTEIFNMAISLMQQDMDARQGINATLAWNDFFQQVNDAMNELAVRVYWKEHSVTFDVSDGVASYNINSAAIFGRQIHRVNKVFRTNVEVPMLTWADFVALYPDWRAAAGGTVQYAVLDEANNLVLYPTPNSTEAGLTWLVEAECNPSQYTSGNASTECPLPSRLHRIVAYLAAILSSEPMITLNDAWGRLAKYEANVNKIVDEVNAKRGITRHAPVTGRRNIGRYL